MDRPHPQMSPCGLGAYHPKRAEKEQALVILAAMRRVVRTFISSLRSLPFFLCQLIMSQPKEGGRNEHPVRSAYTIHNVDNQTVLLASLWRQA